MTDTQNRPGPWGQKSPTARLLEGATPTRTSALVFGAVAGVGMAFIAIAKIYFDVSQFTVTAVPVVIMLTYAAALLMVRGLWLRDDQSGDNLYYLGFLYTLTSLGVSLYQFGKERGTAEDIVANFGIAIATTILGIMLRIIFNQMRRDPAETERTARLELAEAARQIKRQLDDSVIEFNGFRRTLSQSTEEGAAHAEKMTGNSARTVAALEQFAVRLEQIKAPDEIFTSHLKAAIGQIETLVNEIKSRDENQARRTAEILDAAKESASDAKEFGESLNKIIAEGQAVTEKAAESNALVSNAAVKFAQKTGADMDALTGRMFKIGENMEKAAADMERSASDLNAITQSLARVSEQLARQQRGGLVSSLFGRFGGGGR